MKRKLNNNSIFVRFCLHILGLSFSILPPVICTLAYFPLWKYSSEKTLAGGALLLLLLSFIPLYKLIKKRFSSPASYSVWLLIFVGFLLLSKIANEMIVISFYGLVGNLIGAVFFLLSGRKKEEK